MFEWMASTAAPEAPLDSQVLLVRLGTALLLGWCVAIIYRFSHGREKHDSNTLFATLVLLSILIAMVSMVIGNSVARAFSLVGALSIVRFRTVVDDTRDTAFVIFAVIVGMAAGAGLLLVAAIGIPIVAFAAFVLSGTLRTTVPTTNPECELHVRVALGRDPDVILASVFDANFSTYRLIAATTSRQGAALDLTYIGRLRREATMIKLVAAANQIEGVQNVEIRRL